MDMAYAFLQHLYGNKDQGLADLMNLIEYAPHTNPHWDPFSVVHKVGHPCVPESRTYLHTVFQADSYSQVPGADANISLADCVSPVGF
jgi:phosphoribulokinase